MLEKLEERTLLKVDDSEGSPSPPTSPVLSAVEIPGGAKKIGAGSATARNKSPGHDDIGSPTPASRNTSNSKKSGSNGGSVAKKPASTNGSRETANIDGFEGTDDEGEVGTPSTPSSQAKRKPPPRDPSLPKRPQNAYIIFCELEKERVKREIEEANPGHSFDLTKAMAEKWHELTDSERQKFFQIYEDDKERYAREMVACHLPNPSPSEQKEKQRAEKTLRDIEKLRKEGKRPPIVSGSPLAKVIEALSNNAEASSASTPAEGEADADADADVDAEADNADVENADVENADVDNAVDNAAEPESAETVVASSEIPAKEDSAPKVTDTPANGSTHQEQEQEQERKQPETSTITNELTDTEMTDV